MDPAVRAAFRRLFLHLLLAGLALFVAPAVVDAASLRGQVVDPDGRPVAQAEVQVAGPLGVRSVRTDTDGRFEVHDLAAATYRIVVSAAGFDSPTDTLSLADTGNADMRITLALGTVTESVIVSASHVELPRSAAPGSVTVVGREELRDRQIDNLGDALRLVPGLSVSRNGGPGSLTSLFPRGGDSDFTLVLVDGIRLNDFGGGLDLSRVSLSGADQIEVVRGPQSALYGADAMGGVIQIISRQRGAPSSEGLIEAGSRDSTRYGIMTAGSEARWSWNVNAERHASDGDTGIAPASGERVTNDDWLRRHAGASIAWQAEPTTTLRAVGRFSESERGAPGPYGSDPLGAFEGVNRVARGRHDHRQIGVSADHPWGGLGAHARQRWAVTASDLDSDFRTMFGTFLSESALETRRLSFRSQSDFVLRTSTSISAGFEVQSERARSTFVTGERFQEVPIERRVAGYFAEVRQDVSPSMGITAGLRVEHIRRSALERDPNAFSPRPAFDDDVRTSANPRVSWVWAISQADGSAARTRLHASAGTGIRAPDVFEIAFTDNPSLKPERSRSAEAGVSHRLPALDLSVDLTAFYNRFDDLIVAVGSLLRDGSRFRTDNISNARSQGVELAADWRSRWGLQARAAYTWLDTKILAADGTSSAPVPFAPGDPLIRRPRHRGSVTVRFARGPLTAFAEGGARGRTLDVEPNLGTFGGLFDNPGYAVVDAGASVRVARRIDVFGRGLNLLDRRYEETLGYPAPGRGGIIGVRIAVGR
jgi:outer membrane cobalamin receptor